MAIGRGLSVTLCDQYDLAARTSSASTRLIHGGLRYLEQDGLRRARSIMAISSARNRTGRERLRRTLRS
ncbi:MAG: hypothetical protein EPN69_13870 [Rhodanobacter sp.]|nr:MAG: hypothetical protein EPN69_13870 [Rhodanobacter sp.]TAM41621.1 MAG: hypothetical protein EPN58_06065 [Rhodanobacter sp.]TAN29466.1 MAG: hypothetical protein EPN32_00115 [Rhodanobacter sp.]